MTEAKHHSHDHEVEGLRRKIIRIILTVLLLVAAVYMEKNLSLTTWQLFVVYLIPYLLIGYETIW